MAAPTIPSKTDPQLLDKFCDAITVKMLSKLSWLNNAYGKVETQIEYTEAGDLKYPVVYYGAGQDNYETMLPDDAKGNFMYCDPDRKVKHNIMGQIAILEVMLGLVFWFDFTTIYNDPDNRTIENVKSDIIAALRAGIPGLRFDMSEVETVEGLEEIYKGYKLRTKSKQLIEAVMTSH